jgi:DNA-binding NarL/FixJ family response regulator
MGPLTPYLERGAALHGEHGLSDTMTDDFPLIWIVEDETRFGQRLSELINMSEAFRCSGVYRDCESALSALENEIPPDILLMDIGLPGMSGLEGIARVREIAPATQTVILTVFEESDTIVQALSAGASGYLLKGSELGAIIESLKSILGGGAPISPQVAKKILGLFSDHRSRHDGYNLTAREREVLSFLVDGLTKQHIADRLFVSFHTIDKHLRNIYGKLQVRSRTEAVAKALKERLL